MNEYALGRIVAHDLPAVAIQALIDGYDSPSLCQLAGAQGLDSPQLSKLFSNSLQELGLSIPSSAEAGLATARTIAEAVLNGSVTPYQGAKQIWHDIYTRVPQLTQLRPFVGFASEYEDDEGHRDDYSRLIMDECRMLLSE